MFFAVIQIHFFLDVLMVAHTHIRSIGRNHDDGVGGVFGHCIPNRVVNSLRAERDELQRQLDAAAKPETRSAPKQDQEVEAALDALRRLRETFDAAGPEDLRELLPEIVSKVELNYTHKQDGKRSKNKVTGGTIWLRLDPNLSLLCNTSGTHPRSDDRSLPHSPGQRPCAPGFE